jgi:hypothetical protein
MVAFFANLTWRGDVCGSLIPPAMPSRFAPNMVGTSFKVWLRDDNLQCSVVAGE